VLIRRNSDDFCRRLLSPAGMSLRCDLLCRCEWCANPRPLCLAFDANLLWPGSRRRPPVLIVVNSSGVDRRVALSPPDNSNCNTCVWFIPWTCSPLTCVIKSPGLRPASKAGLPESTAYTTFTLYPLIIIITIHHQNSKYASQKLIYYQYTYRKIYNTHFPLI